VRALPLSAGINEGGHYFGPSGVRALTLAAGINVGSHYCYLLVRAALCRRFRRKRRRPLFLVNSSTLLVLSTTVAKLAWGGVVGL
jgi:hypothetical protein